MAIDSQSLIVFTLFIRAVVFALYFVYRYQLYSGHHQTSIY